MVPDMPSFFKPVEIIYLVIGKKLNLKKFILFSGFVQKVESESD